MAKFQGMQWFFLNFLRNLHQLFVLCTASQIIGGYFAKFCGLLRIYELYNCKQKDQSNCCTYHHIEIVSKMPLISRKIGRKWPKILKRTFSKMRAVGTHRNTVIKDLVFTFLGWRHFFAKLAKFVPIPKKTFSYSKTIIYSNFLNPTF